VTGLVAIGSLTAGKDAPFSDRQHVKPFEQPVSEDLYARNKKIKSQ